MVETVPYALGELLRERREGSVRAIVRAVGYALAMGRTAEDVGQFLFDSHRLAGEFERRRQAGGERNGVAFAAHHLLARWGWCDDVTVGADQGGLLVESASMLENHDEVLGFHGVTRMDMEACMERFWRLSGQALGLSVTYTIGDDRDWAIIRGPGGSPLSSGLKVEQPVFTSESLAEHRRLSLATGITFSIGYAKHTGDEPQELGRFFYRVWEGAGHYDRVRERSGFGNALAYAQSMARSRQVLYTHTDMLEDLDGYTIASPSWATEIPQVMGMFGCLPEDVYHYYEGGGVAACIKLGLQYADRSDDHNHRVWIRSR